MKTYTPARELFDRVQKDFRFPLKDRLRIVADVDMFRSGEDESLWKQKKDEKYNYQVYFDNEFVCFFDVTQALHNAYLNVMKSLLELYRDKKIHWNTFLYEFDKPKPKPKKKKVKPKGTGIGHKIITDVLNKRNGNT